MNFSEGDNEWRVVDLSIHKDKRGIFYEAYKEDDFFQTIGFKVAQVNVSVSARGVFRGLHLMKPSYGQRKYVLCVTGKVIDFAIDLRRDSAHFGHVRQQILEPGDCAVYVPNGFAHGFLSLKNSSTVVYLCDTNYSPENEVGINPNDEALKGSLIASLSELKISAPILSAKDASAPSLQEVLQTEKF